MIDMFLPLKPVPKQRPRLCGGRVYTPEKTKQAERDIVLLVNNYMRQKGLAISDGPLAVTLVFQFKSDKPTFHHTKRPDLDNLAKTVLDAMNNLVYLDDCQVCRLICEKQYGVSDGIFLTVGEM